MSYFQLLGLDKEPFSTSPDPDFLYESNEHKSALYRIGVMIELKRGLATILGEVGTGKTTLLRKLLQIFNDTSKYMTYVILDPTSKTEYTFLQRLAETFNLNPGFRSTSNYKKALDHFVFEAALEQKKTVILFIDEAQKLSTASLEILRLLLNYETNQNKLIQIVLFAQMEFLPLISRIKNFWDRIALKYVVNPLEEFEVKEMLEFRLKQAGYVSRDPLFSDSCINAIYNYTQGYPRRITMLCHNALEYLVMKKKEMVDKNIIQDIIQNEVKPVIT